MRGLSCNQIEVDEIWGFVGAKRKNANRVGAYGDVWTFIALDADTKLIPSFVVGKRDAYHAKMFISDLAGRMQKRVQVSSDGLAAYADAMERGFGAEVDYGQVSKTYSFENLTQNAAGRYSPAEVIKVEKVVITGMPDVNRICTSHIEKQNHTLRMHCRGKRQNSAVAARRQTAAILICGPLPRSRYAEIYAFVPQCRRLDSAHAFSPAMAFDFLRARAGRRAAFGRVARRTCLRDRGSRISR